MNKEKELHRRSADSPTVPPAPYTGKMEVTVSDRTLVSEGPARLVCRSSEDAGIGLRPDAGSLSDQTLIGCI